MSFNYHVSNITVISEEKVKRLIIYKENRLNFDYHIGQLCRKSGKKFSCSNSSFQIHEHFTFHSQDMKQNKQNS